MASLNLSPEDRFFFAKEFLASGRSAKEWTDEFGISRTTLYKWLKEFDLSLPSSKDRDASEPPQQDSNALALNVKQDIVKVDLTSILRNNHLSPEDSSDSKNLSLENIYFDRNTFEGFNDCDCEVTYGDLKIAFTKNLPPELLSIVCKTFGGIS